MDVVLFLILSIATIAALAFLCITILGLCSVIREQIHLQLRVNRRNDVDVSVVSHFADFSVVSHFDSQHQAAASALYNNGRQQKESTQNDVYKVEMNLPTN